MLATPWIRPCEFTKKFAVEKDTKHADQRDSLALQTLYSYFKMTFEKVKMYFHQLTIWQLSEYILVWDWYRPRDNQAHSCSSIITYMMTRKSAPNFWKYRTTLVLSLTRSNPLSNNLPNHISEAFLVARSKYKNILWTVSLGRGGKIPKGGRAGRARFLGI